MASQMNMHGVVDLGALAAARKAEAASAVAKANAPAGVIIDVTDATFERDVLQQSAQVPVILDFGAAWSAPSQQLSPILEKLAAEYGGRLLLAKVDAEANPGMAQAFRVQAVPSVFALVAGQPVPLFQNAVPEAQVRQFFDKVLEAAAAAGVTGTVGGAVPAEAPANDAAGTDEPAVDPRYMAIHDAIERGEFELARQAAAALADARDPEGPGMLAYVAVRRRMSEQPLEAARAAYAAAPDNVAAMLAASDHDLFIQGSKPVYDRLIAALRVNFGDERIAIKDRLIEYFAIDGDTPEAIAARKQMTAALF